MEKLTIAKASDLALRVIAGRKRAVIPIRRFTGSDGRDCVELDGGAHHFYVEGPEPSRDYDVEQFGLMFVGDIRLEWAKS